MPVSEPDSVDMSGTWMGLPSKARGIARTLEARAIKAEAEVERLRKRVAYLEGEVRYLTEGDTSPGGADEAEDPEEE